VTSQTSQSDLVVSVGPGIYRSLQVKVKVQAKVQVKVKVKVQAKIGGSRHNQHRYAQA
jgi:hypothetical protein